MEKLFLALKVETVTKKNMREFNHFLLEQKVEMIEVDVEVARLFAEIQSDLRKIGKPIPTNDIWIAACALKVNGTLLTCDSDFKYIKKLKFKNPD